MYGTEANAERGLDCAVKAVAFAPRAALGHSVLGA
jgi:hypothetical protein